MASGGSARGKGRLKSRTDLTPAVQEVLAVRRHAANPWTHDDASVVAAFVGFSPSEPFPGTMKPWSGTCLLCDDPHVTSPTLSNLLRGSEPCRHYVGKTPEAAEIALRNDMASFGIEILEYRGNEDLTALFPCGHKVAGVSAGNLRRNPGAGCGVCHGLVVQEGVNDLATTHALFALETWTPHDPKKFTYGSNLRVLWCCLTCQHKWYATPGDRTVGGIGCPACSNRAVVQGFNDLATTHPRLASEIWVPWCAKQIVAGSNRIIRWCCSACGFVWPASPTTRTRSGCPECSEYGYKRTEAGWIYVVRGVSARTGELLVKPGIANSIQQRLAKHERQGLAQTVALAGWHDGEIAWDLEQEWKAARRGLPKFARPGKDDLPDGYREAVISCDEAVPALQRLLRRIEHAAERHRGSLIRVEVFDALATTDHST